MGSLGQTLLNLAFVVPALAAPGPLFSTLLRQPRSQLVDETISLAATLPESTSIWTPTSALLIDDKCDADKQGEFRCDKDTLLQYDGGEWVDYMECPECQLNGDSVTCKVHDGPDDSPDTNSFCLPELPVVSSRSELSRRRKHKKPKPSQDTCTPGDRRCHYTLDHILMCDDNRQWVTYSPCKTGTFCHRLYMICVNKPIPEEWKQVISTDEPVRCKGGDRRCDPSFNRVDRCNDDGEWVTYHDCLMAESCNESVLECIPLNTTLIT
ncbi:hypothetical protein F5Y19DRAFT_424972 [Xylariaceae sp. FL1651]|nr:hypothetical protein F5Y19DRAFT_424972 [Xylariaceae sp. FL1651]